MTQVTEAIFADGVLKPVENLHLRENERVRIIVENVSEDARPDRVEAMKRLRAGIEAMSFRSAGPYPSRDELHERR